MEIIYRIIRSNFRIVVPILFVALGSMTYLYVKSQARIVIQKSIYQDAASVDFGSIPIRSIGEKVVGIKNPYSVPIEIVSASTSCGCSKASTTTARMAPGELGSVTVKMKASAPAGSQRVMLNVNYRLLRESSPRTETKSMTAQSTDYAIFSEETFDFGVLNSKDGFSTSRQISITKHLPNQHWNAVETNSESGIQSSVKQISSTHWLVDCKLVSAKWTTGPLRGNVNACFMLDGHNVAIKQIPVKGYIQGPIVVKPQTIFLGAIKAGETVTKMFSLHGIKLEGQEESKLEWQVPPFIKVTALNREGSDSMFRLEMISPNEPGIISDVAVTTVIDAAGNFETIGIPYTALIE